ncbi:MAG: hypothetical protein WEA76_04325 [Acidimicrobiia bacterium]
MARRSRDRRKTIPGYDELRPRRDDRARDHRKVRHAANQMLHTATDVEELAPLPEVRADHHHDRIDLEPVEAPKNRFTVGKTKFWKRRGQYKQYRARLDARWPELDNSEG